LTHALENQGMGVRLEQGRQIKEFKDILGSSSLDIVMLQKARNWVLTNRGVLKMYSEMTWQRV